MSLLDVALEVAYGNRSVPAQVEFGLFRGDREVVANGYTRVVVKRGAWKVRNGSLSTELGFVGWSENIEFDRVVALVDGKSVEENRVGVNVCAAHTGATIEFEASVMPV